MLLVGEIGKPHGIRGEVYVTPISDDPRRFTPGSTLVHEARGEVVVEAARQHHDRLLVRFAGVDARASAAQLRGALYVRAADTRELRGDEFWEHEVIGCVVWDAEGARVGEVADVVPGPAQDLLRVATPRGERLVPMVAAIVLAIDVEDRRVVIDPPAGLLD
jgi:16S rRNA processing protein RimM